MSCAKILSGILPYIDGRLQAKGRAEIEKHLAACASCRLRMEQFRAVAVLLDQLPVIEPALAFDVRALAAGAVIMVRILGNLECIRLEFYYVILVI
jgi:anti-sigma factor RsiW